MPELINNLVVVSDLHVGCRVALAHPDGHEMDDGAIYQPTKLQQVMWAWWEEFWHEWVPEVTHGEPYAVCLNGDCLDGVHHNSVTQWTHNLTYQRRAAVKILRPVVARCGGRYYHIRGTEAHAGKSGQDEEEIAQQLGAIPNDQGQYARYELWIRIGRGLAHVTHHIGTAGSMHYESTAVMREMSEAYNESGRWGQEPPDWIVRSHRHRNIEVRVQTRKGFATGLVTPGWQLKTPFAYRIAGARQAQPQIGGSLLRCGDQDLFTRHRVWDLARPATEECHTTKEKTRAKAKSVKPRDHHRPVAGGAIPKSRSRGRRLPKRR